MFFAIADSQHKHLENTLADEGAACDSADKSTENGTAIQIEIFKEHVILIF